MATQQTVSRRSTNHPSLLSESTTYAQNRQVVLASARQRPFSCRFLGPRTLFLFSTLSIAFYLWLGYSPEKAIHQLDYASRAEKLMRISPLVDGHNDLPYLLRLELKNRIYEGRLDFAEGLKSHTDLKRLREGRVGGQFWSVFVEHSVRDTLEQIDVAHRLFEEYPDLHYCDNSACAMSAFKRGHIASMLGAEGMHQVGSAIAVIRQFFSLGVRYITLTHNCDNPFATAASTVSSTGLDSGLSSIGRSAITEMNRLGMMVDLSHVSHNTMRNVLDITKSPVMFSHSSCYALAENYRNVPDDVLLRLRQNGGVVMVMFVKRFLNAREPEKANLEAAVDHIFHVAKVAGWDHVGIGTDFDGTVTLAHGIDDVTAYPSLIEAVLRRGATDAQVKKLLGENILRVWRENEIIAMRVQNLEGKKPIEDVWEGRRWTRWNNPLPVMIEGNRERIRARDYE